MCVLVGRSVIRWPRCNAKSAWVVLAIWCVFTAGLVGCGSSPNEGAGIVAPSAQAGVQSEPTTAKAPRQNSIPTPTPTGHESSAAIPTAVVGPTGLEPQAFEATGTTAPVLGATPPATPPPTVVPTPNVMVTPIATPTPDTSVLMLEYSDISTELEDLILGGQYLLKRDVENLPDVRPRVKKISCDDQSTIRSVNAMIENTHSSSMAGSKNENVEEIGVISWVVPWEEGFLHFGYPRVLDPCDVELVYENGVWDAWWYPSASRDPYLLFRISRDGQTWTMPERFVVPFNIPMFDESLLAKISARSNGRQLIIAAHQPGGVSVSTTSDLATWEISEVQFRPPDMLNEYLSTSIWLENVAISPIGWIIGTTIEVHIGDIPIPEHILESAAEILTNFYDFDTYSADERGIQVRWLSEGEGESSTLVLWEELGIDYDTFMKYMFPAYNKMNGRYSTPTEQFHGMIWSDVKYSQLSRGQVERWIELPNNLTPGVCCKIVGTDAGYIASDIPFVPGGYPAITHYDSDEEKLFFSSDGSEWRPIQVPSSDMPNASRYLIDKMFTVTDGVLISFATYDMKSEQSFVGNVGSVVWLTDPSGNTWQNIEETQYAYLADWIHEQTKAFWRNSIGVVWPRDWPQNQNSLVINGSVALALCAGGTIGRIAASDHALQGSQRVPCVSD